MKKLNNPFVIYGYKGAEYFCDRVAETEKIIKGLGNERNITLIAPRRIGKTGLIRHVFAQIRKSQPEVSSANTACPPSAVLRQHWKASRKASTSISIMVAILSTTVSSACG